MRKNWAGLALGLLLFSAHGAAQPLLKDGQLEIDRESFLTVLSSSMPEEYFNELLKSPERLERHLRDQYLVKVMAQRAVERKLDQQPAVAGRLEYIRVQFLAKQYVQDYMSQVEDIDYLALAKENYTLNKDKFVSKESVHAEHILISSKDRDEQAAKQLAEEVYAKAKSRAYKDKFSELAVEYSEDPSVASNKGDLGTFERGRMVPEFEQAVFELKKKGALSAPVKTGFGYHIIRLIEYKPARQLGFEEVKQQLVADAEKTYKQKKQSELVDSIMSAPEIQVDLEALKNLSTQSQ